MIQSNKESAAEISSDFIKEVKDKASGAPGSFSFSGTKRSSIDPGQKSRDLNRNCLSEKHSGTIIETGTIWLLDTFGITLCFHKFGCSGVTFQHDFPNPVVPKPAKPDKPDKW